MFNKLKFSFFALLFAIGQLGFAAAAPLNVAPGAGPSAGRYAPVVVWQSSVVSGAGTTMTAGKGYFTDTTSAGFTITLPASAAVNDQIGVADATGKWCTNNLTIANNGLKIYSTAANLTADLCNRTIVFIYTGATIGWVML